MAGNADGAVVIDTKIRTEGISKDLTDIKGKFSSVAKSASRASQQIENSFTQSISKTVAAAQLRVQTLENKFSSLSAKFAEAIAADDDKEAVRLGARMEAVYDRLEEARKKLRIDTEHEARKQAAAEEKAAKKIEKAHTEANDKVKKGTQRATNVAGKFKQRLSGIAASAFLFNALSEKFREISDYITKAVTSSDNMRSALANLKGAAQQAATPIIEAITPALTKMTNAVATAASYLAQLFAAFSGKSIQQVANSAKSFNKATNAANKMSKALAGFDELTILSDNANKSDSKIEPNYGYVAGSVGFLEEMKNSILKGNWFDAGETLAQRIMESIRNTDWNAVGEKIGAIIGAVFSFALGFALNIDPFELIGTINDFTAGLLKSISETIQNLDWVDIGRKMVKALLFGVIMADPALALLTIITSPNGDDLVASLSELLGSILGALVGLIYGLGQGTADVAIALWQSIRTWFDENIDWGGTPGEIISGLLSGIVDAFVGIGDWIYNNIWVPFRDGFKKSFDIHSPSQKMYEFGGLIIDGLVNGITGAIDRVSQACTDIWLAIKGKFEGVGTWLEETFSGAWERVKGIFTKKDGESAFEGIKEGISTTFKNTVNNLITGINQIVTKPFESINSMLNTIRDIRVLGVSPFQGLWGYNPIGVPQIPYLAKGAVIPPNAPFAAILGDQRHGTNIEAPLSTIQEAVALVMEDYTAANIAGHEATVTVLRDILEAVLGIHVGDDVIGQAVSRYNAKMAIIRGGTV